MLTFASTYVIIPIEKITKDCMIMKKVTIQDIADTLGISRNTVSKAINNSDGLADDTLWSGKI